MPRGPLSQCPYCGRVEMSKNQLASEILKLIGFGEKKSIYSDGNLSKFEMTAIYNYIKKLKGGDSNAKA